MAFSPDNWNSAPGRGICIAFKPRQPNGHSTGPDAIAAPNAASQTGKRLRGESGIVMVTFMVTWQAMIAGLPDRIQSTVTLERRAASTQPARREGDLELGEQSANDNVKKDETKFDWVAERSDCSLPKVYRTLMAEVEEDVKARNAQRPELAPYEFSMEEKLDTFVVHLRAKDFHRSITFSLEEHGIIVLDNSGNQMFEVSLTFTDEGKCRMNAKQMSRDSWQVRRMALEDLLFRSL
jgi:hypothetical protein